MIAFVIFSGKSLEILLRKVIFNQTIIDFKIKNHTYSINSLKNKLPQNFSSGILPYSL